MKFTWPLIFLILFFSCTNSETSKEENVAARIGEKVLLKSDIPDIFNLDLTPDDSIQIAGRYVKNWIKKELLLKKAETNLTREQQAKISRQLEDTRASLLIYQYELEMIRQRMDTVISEDEIQAYYDSHAENFILKKNIVQVLYLKIPLTAPNIEKARNWYKSEDDSDITKLESYCYQFANKYDDFNESWIYFDELLSKLPMPVSNQERYLRYNKNIETSDSAFHYFVNIRDYKLKSSVSPLEFVKDQIRNIIYNERKINFIKELENSLYNDAVTRNEFMIY